MTAPPPNTFVVMLADGSLTRGVQARIALLCPDSFVCAWRCLPNERCYAPNGVTCDCTGSNAGHDPGDEDRSKP